MQDCELYGRILGIAAPWRVERVELQLKQGEVHVYLAHENKLDCPCAECAASCALYDNQAERQWRHWDTCQYRTILDAAPPRSQCREHGVRVVQLPWAEANSRFTALMEGLAIAWLKHASQKAVAEQLRLSWDEIHGIMERAVQRGLARRKAEKIPHLGVDEKAFRRGHKHLTLGDDLTHNRVPGTKYDWLRNPAVMDAERRRDFAQLRQSELKTARAWALKETAMAFFNYVYEKPARKHFQWWYNWAVRSRLEPMKEKAAMLKRRFENIITYLRHQITNAASESLNAKIQWVKYTARGFRNQQNFINAIYFHCGGLDLDPTPTT